MWAALAFVSLAAVAGSGYLLPDDPDTTGQEVALRIAIALLVLFPYLLYRFASAFELTRRQLARFVDSLTTALVVATIALPHIPAEGDPWPWWFVVYAVAFLVHWSVLLQLVAIRLWRAARAEATVARRRMRMLALASTALAVTLLLSVGAGNDHSWFALTVGLLATLSAVGFLLGFAPPALLRLLWRRPEQSKMQLAIGELMGATTEQDAAARVLPPMAEMVGARGIVLEGPDGTVVAEHRAGEDDPNGDVRRLEFAFGTIVVRTSAFAPFFGDEERKLLYALGSLTSLALDRSRLFAQERQAREALERADELKNQFVALAAHELRSPVSAIYGISETIAERGPQLAPEQLDELQRSLTSQIRRLRELVEQLLDLSRLDADAVTINPQRVRVRERLERIVHAVAPLDASEDRDRGGRGARSGGRRRRTRADRLQPDRQRVPVRRAARRRPCRSGRRCPARDRRGQRAGRPGRVRVAAVRPLRPRRVECVDRHGHGPGARDRSLVRASASRRGQLPAGCAARRGVRADAAHSVAGVES